MIKLEQNVRGPPDRGLARLLFSFWQRRPLCKYLAASDRGGRGGLESGGGAASQLKYLKIFFLNIYLAAVDIRGGEVMPPNFSDVVATSTQIH